MATTSRLGKNEVRISVAVIAILLLILGLVAARRLTGGGRSVTLAVPAPLDATGPAPGAGELPGRDQATELPVQAAYGDASYPASPGDDAAGWRSGRGAADRMRDGAAHRDNYMPKPAGLTAGPGSAATMRQEDPAAGADESISTEPAAPPDDRLAAADPTPPVADRYQAAGASAVPAPSPGVEPPVRAEPVERTASRAAPDSQSPQADSALAGPSPGVPRQAQDEPAGGAAADRSLEPADTDPRAVDSPSSGQPPEGRYGASTSGTHQQEPSRPAAAERARRKADPAASTARHEWSTPSSAFDKSTRGRARSTLPAEPAAGPPTPESYVVRPGDTLFDIARAELGDGSRWFEIFQLNRRVLRGDYNHLPPGTRLVLPPPPPTTAAALGRKAVRILR